jgi:hypothetical protein
MRCLLELFRLDDPFRPPSSIPKTGAMRVPVILYAEEALVREMDDKVCPEFENFWAFWARGGRNFAELFVEEAPKS